MSLCRISPLLTRCTVRCRSNRNNTLLPPNRINTSAARRGLSTPPTKAEKKMSAEEVEAALEKANESMKAYYSYPPEKVIAAKKAKFE